MEWFLVARLMIRIPENQLFDPATNDFITFQYNRYEQSLFPGTHGKFHPLPYSFYDHFVAGRVQEVV